MRRGFAPWCFIYTGMHIPLCNPVSWRWNVAAWNVTGLCWGVSQVSEAYLPWVWSGCCSFLIYSFIVCIAIICGFDTWSFSLPKVGVICRRDEYKPGFYSDHGQCSESSGKVFLNFLSIRPFWGDKSNNRWTKPITWPLLCTCMRRGKNTTSFFVVIVEQT